jgi:hypothetical protein
MEMWRKFVAVVNLVMNFRFPRKFRKFLYQLKNNVIYKCDLLSVEVC